MSEESPLQQFHWMFEMLQIIDVGVLVLDKHFHVHAWNGFMENHSGIDSQDIIGKNLFAHIEGLEEMWFRHKAATVFQLKSQAFTIWEQRPYLFKFANYRPITSAAEFMYQNSTFVPIKNPNGVVDQIAVLIYDVTDLAMNKIEELQQPQTLATSKKQA